MLGLVGVAPPPDKISFNIDNTFFVQSWIEAEARRDFYAPAGPGA